MKQEDFFIGFHCMMKRVMKVLFDFVRFSEREKSDKITLWFSATSGALPKE
jgi:hypothetical protein